MCFNNGFINIYLFLSSFLIRIPTTILLILAFIFFLFIFRRRFCQRSLIFILLFHIYSDDNSTNARLFLFSFFIYVPTTVLPTLSLSLFSFFIYVPTTVLPTLAYLYSLFLFIFR